MGGLGRAFDRMCDVLLDRGSTALYGDERERVRWYEAISVGSALTSIAVPWALLVLALIDADRFAPALWTVLGVWMVPLLVANLYVHRGGGRMPEELNRTGWAVVGLTYGPLVAFLAVMSWPITVLSWAAIVAGVVIALVAAVDSVRKGRRKASGEPG